MERIKNVEELRAILEEKNYKEEEIVEFMGLVKPFYDFYDFMLEKHNKDYDIVEKESEELSYEVMDEYMKDFTNVDSALKLVMEISGEVIKRYADKYEYLESDKVKTALNKIVLIGSGNVATNFAFALKKAKKSITQIYSLNLEHAKRLALIADADFTDDITKLDKTADLYILAVNDSKIEDISGKLRIDDGLLVHTAGSVDMNVLKNASTNVGVLYPLQTLSREQNIDFYREVPICIESDNSVNENLLKELASTISEKVFILTSEERAKVHLAAVIVNNFSNYLYASAEKYLQSNQLSFDLLKALISRTNDISVKGEKQLLLTGPAVRKDVNVIRKHMEMLEGFPELRKVYELISENIIKQS